MYSPLKTRNGLPINTELLVIDSARLRIVPVTMDDKQTIYKHFDHHITRYMVPKVPECEADVEHYISDALQGAITNTDLQLAVRHSIDNELLGCCGLHQLEKDTVPEVGIWIKQSAHGHGYGFEAITAIKAWARDLLDYPYLIYPVDKENGASRRIPERLGAKVVDRYTVNNVAGKQLNIMVYYIPLI